MTLPATTPPAARAAGRVVVGYEGGGTGEDAVAFARRWAGSSGDELVVVTVHPGPAPVGAGRVDAEWVAYERKEAGALLDEARGLVGPDVKASFERVDAGSAAHGLHDLLSPDPDDTPLLVLGSRRTRGLRRTYPGSTAERLLQGSPAPVAMVPWGYAESADHPLGTVAVAYVDTPDGHVALGHAGRIAAHLGADLVVLSVVPDTRVQPDLGELRSFEGGQRGQFSAALDAVLAELPAGVTARGQLLDGPVVDALTEVSPQDCDLLVCGSRGYGPVRSVLLGGVSSRVVRHSRVPVVVVPRGG